MPTPPDRDDKKPAEGPAPAVKKPRPKGKNSAREDRLAEALRANLRRRKAGAASEESKDS